MSGSLDEACLHRLFWRENVMVRNAIHHLNSSIFLWVFYVIQIRPSTWLFPWLPLPAEIASYCMKMYDSNFKLIRWHSDIKSIGCGKAKLKLWVSIDCSFLLYKLPLVSQVRQLHQKAHKASLYLVSSEKALFFFGPHFFWQVSFFQVLQHLAQLNQDLLLWHLKQHEGALILCVQTIAEHPFTAPIIGENDDMYTSEDDYFSEDEDALEATG